MLNVKATNQMYHFVSMGILSMFVVHYCMSLFGVMMKLFTCHVFFCYLFNCIDDNIEAPSYLVEGLAALVCHLKKWTNPEDVRTIEI